MTFPYVLPLMTRVIQIRTLFSIELGWRKDKP